MTMTNERERVTALLFYALLLLLAYLVFRVFEPFLVPLGWAAVLVVFFYRWHARLERRWGRSRAAALSTAAVTLILIVPMLFVMSAFVNEAVDALGNARRVFAGELPPWARRAWQTVQLRMPGGQLVDMTAIMNDAAQGAASWLAAQAGAILQNVALFVFDLIVVVFATFFLFRDADAIMRGVRHALPVDERLRERMIAQTGELVVAGVSSSLIVAAVQGLLGGLAFWALGIGAPVFWGVVMALFCLLPFGAWVIWMPAAIWLMLTGNLVRGLVLVGLGAGIVSSVDNFLRPALLSGRTQLNGLLVFISLLGGVSVFGVLGIVLGPILMATAVGLFEAYTAERAQRRPQEL